MNEWRSKLRLLKSILQMSNFDFNKSEPLYSKARYFIFSIIYAFKLNYFRKLILAYCFIDKKYFRNKKDLENIYKGLQSIEIFDIESIRTRVARREEVLGEYARQIINNGYADLTNKFVFTESEITEFVKGANSTLAYNAQVPIASRDRPSKIDMSSQYYSLPLDASFLTPFYKKFLQNPLVRLIANDYLGGESSLYAVNTMVTTPSKNIHSVTDLHRDRDDIHFLTFFIYWTTTSEINGATYIVPESHIDLSMTSECGIYLNAMPGSVFAVDTFALHSGNKNVTSSRVVSWFRFANRINAASFGNKNYLYEHYLNDLIK